MKKIGVLGLLSIFLMLNLVLLMPNSAATKAEVVIILDTNFVEFKMEENASNLVTVSGNVTCEIEGLGKEIQEIFVYLSVGDEQSWEPGVAPASIIFDENGRQKINVTVNVKRTALNRSINSVHVHGKWEAEPTGIGPMVSYGDVVPDQVDIKVYRTSSPFFSTSKSGPPDEPKELSEVLGLPCMVGLIVIPIVIIIILIIYFYRRKKNYGFY